MCCSRWEQQPNIRRHRWNMIRPAKIIGEMTGWFLFMDPTKRSRWVWSLTALTSGKFSGVRPSRLLYASTEVSSTAHVTSARNAPEQTKRPIQDPFSHRETHIVRMTRRAVVFTGKECCFYDSDGPVSEKGYSQSATDYYFSEGPVT